MGYLMSLSRYLDPYPVLFHTVCLKKADRGPGYTRVNRLRKKLGLRDLHFTHHINCYHELSIPP